LAHQSVQAELVDQEILKVVDIIRIWASDPKLDPQPRQASKTQHKVVTIYASVFSRGKCWCSTHIWSRTEWLSALDPDRQSCWMLSKAGCWINKLKVWVVTSMFLKKACCDYLRPITLSFSVGTEISTLRRASQYVAASPLFPYQKWLWQAWPWDIRKREKCILIKEPTCPQGDRHPHVDVHTHS